MGRGWRGQMLTSLSSRATGGAGLYPWIGSGRGLGDQALLSDLGPQVRISWPGF